MRPEDINTVVVIGGGCMGQGIAQSFAQAKLTVRIVDIDLKQLDNCVAQLDANLKLFQEVGLLEEDGSEIKKRIHPFQTKDMDKAIEGCHFIVEAVPEDLELKRQLFSQLDICHEEVIISSNTSSFPVSVIAEGCRNVHRIIGLHYFNPAQIIPLVEIHRGPQTSDRIIDITKKLMLRVGKKPILLKKEIPGFIVNRIQAAMVREMMYLVDEGVASPAEVETAYKASVGIRYSCIGQFEFSDVIGLDFGVRMGGLLKTLNNSTDLSTMMVEKVKRGELGIKTGRGWFDWTTTSREEIIDNQNRRLLMQLALYKEMEKYQPLYKKFI